MTGETLKAWPSDVVLWDEGIKEKILPPRGLGGFHQGGKCHVNLRELKSFEMGRATQRIPSAVIHMIGSSSWAENTKAVTQAILQARPKIEAARDALLPFLSSEI